MSKATASSETPPKINNSNTAAGEYLLERLRILLNRLQAATEILHKWPEADGDSAKIHNDTATELISSIRKIVLAARTIERHINGSSQHETITTTGIIPKEALEAFRKSLDTKCPIPLDLLDLLDVGAIFGMNPQVYARGLMKESLKQLSGLERRKKGLGMLADSLEKGMAKCGDGDDTMMMDSQKPGVLKSEASAAVNANEEDKRSLAKTKSVDDTVMESQKPGVSKSEPSSALNVKEEDERSVVTGDANKRKRDDIDEDGPVLKKERVDPGS